MIKEYLRELLSIQCEHAYGTMQRLKDAGGLSDADRKLIVVTQDILITLRDTFRVSGSDTKEARDGQEGQG